MSSIYKSILGLSALALVTLSGCKKYRDINDSPDNPAQVNIQLLLPSAEAHIAQQIGGKFQVIGGIWSQYWTQNPSASQYRVFEQYQIAGSDIDNAWTGLYADGLEDLNKIVELSGGSKNYASIANILKGYTFQVLTDQFGDIPFTEALQGETNKITSPHYDSQEKVYNGIIAMVQSAVDSIDGSAAPGSDDLIYGGDMTKWQKFGNTLLLKMYMRLAEKSPAVAQAGIQALYANGIGFIGDGETAKIAYSSEAGNYNPLYSEINNAVINKTQNLIASKTAADNFNNEDDPRIALFYAPGTSGFGGLTQGDYFSSAAGTSFARPSAAVGGDASTTTSATAPVIFISDYESYLLQAEAAVRGWGTGNAKALYEAAIAANFNQYQAAFAQAQADEILPTLVADSMATSPTTKIASEIKYDIAYAVNTYINGDSALVGSGAYSLDGDSVFVTTASSWGQFPTGGTPADQLKFIITQKWYCMCGNQSLEAWTEWRRTGYPTFFTHSVNSVIGTNFPQRFPYPDGEVSNNLNFPGQKTVTEKVWWDVN